MNTFKLENEKEVGRILRQFFELLVNSENLSIDEYLNERNYEIDKKDDPFRILYRNKYIKEHYGFELLLEIIDLLYQHYYLNRKIDVIKIFYDLIKKSYIDWVVIFPIEYSKYFIENKTSKKYSLINYFLTPPFKSKEKFMNFVKVEYNVESFDLDSLDHVVRTAGDFILDERLLISKLHGDRLVVRNKGLQFFRNFKALNELYVARYGNREFYNTLKDETCDHYFLLNVKKGNIERRTLWDGSRIKWVFNDKLFMKFKKNNFEIYLELLLTGNDKIVNRLRNSLKFFVKGYNEKDNITRFVFYVIAMESIFSRDKNNPIKVTLADNISLLCYDKKERLEIHKKIKNIYDIRSEIVHAGKTSIEEDMVNLAENISSRAILDSFRLYNGFSDKKDIENNFFNYLLTLKLIK